MPEGLSLKRLLDAVGARLQEKTYKWPRQVVLTILPPMIFSYPATGLPLKFARS